MTRVGVVADTHGRFDPRLREHFNGVEHILHAGDVGNEQVLTQLASIAPLTAVTGNVDWGGPLDRRLPRTVRLELAGVPIWITHIGDDPERLVQHLPSPRPRVFIYGHSHIALISELDGVLFLNPGSAGAPRFGRRPSCALLHLDNGRVEAELIWL